MTSRFWSGLAVTLAVAIPAAAFAQDRSALLLKVPTAPAMGAATGRAQPGVSTASPLGFGPNMGDVFVGFGYQNEARGTTEDDGSASLGFGLGNSQSMVGLEAVITSLSTVREGFFKRTALGLKLHRDLPNDAAIGVGVEGIMLNGGTDSKTSAYVALSKYASLGSGEYFNAVTLNVGAGNGRFQRVADFAADKNGINVFASAGLRVTSWLGAIGEYTGQDVNLGLSLAPIPSIPLVITPALADVTTTANDKVRFTLGAGLSWHY